MPKLIAAAALLVTLTAGAVATAPAAAAATDSYTITSGNAVSRPTLGFGINWTPYWDKPSPYDPATNPRDPLTLTDTEWLTVLNRLNYLNLSTMRTMVLPGWVNPTATANGNVYDDTGMMHALYRTLDYARSRNITTVIGYWDARQPFDGNEGGATYLESLADLVDHLINVRHYTNIKYVIAANEPQHRFDTYAQYRTAVQTLHALLQRPSLAGKVSIMGPDVGGDGTGWLASSTTDLSTQLGSYEWHDYPSGQNDIKSTSAGSILKTLQQNITAADPSNKPLVLGEMGWFYGVTANDDQPNVRTFQYGLEVGDLGVQAARNGWSSIAWYLDDEGNDKLWGMWDIKDEPALRPWFYSWSMLSRAFRPGMTLFNPTNPADLRLLAGTSGGNWSFALVNRRSTEAVVNVAVPGQGTVNMNRFVYGLSQQPKDANGFPVPVDQVSGNLGSGVEVTVPANAVVVATNVPQSTNIDDSMTGGGLHRLSLTGSWGVDRAAMTGEYNRSTTYSATAGNTAQMSFRGKGLRLYAHRGPGGGNAAISVDGGPEQIVSFYNPTADGNVQIWSTSGLASGEHTITVRVTGTHPSGSSSNYVALDRLEVLN